MRKFFLAFGGIFTVHFLYRLLFYTNHNWFSHPTLQGMIFLFVLLFILIYAFGIGFEIFLFPQKYNSVIVKILSINRSPFAKVFLRMSAIACLFYFFFNNWNNCQIIKTLCGNQDLLLGLSFLIYILSYPELLDESTSFSDMLSTFWSLLSKNFLPLLYILLVTIKSFVIIPSVYSLIVPKDAIQYLTLAKQFFEGNPDFVAFHHYPPIYSMAITPAFIIPTENILKAISLINILISSSAIFPIFWISRKYLNNNLACLITLISATYPYHFVYPYYPASENLYYPLFFFIIFLLICSPKQKKYQPFWDLLLGIIISISYLVRFQTLPLIPVYLVCYWTKPDLHQPDQIFFWPNKEKTVRISRVMLGLIVPIAIWLVIGSQQGVGLKDLFGLTVEGENALFMLNPKHGSIYLWLFLTTAYFVLIAGPALIYFPLLSWKNGKSLSLGIKHWLFLTAMVMVMLFITVFRHAWIAYYNAEEPQKLLTRYCIYLSVLFWITAVILIENIAISSWKKYLVFSVSAILLLFGSYELFHDKNWIFEKSIIKFQYIDGHISGFLGWIYFLILLVFTIATMLAIFNKRIKLVSPILLITIGILNLSSLSGFHKNIMRMELPGRFLSEINDEIISKLSKEEINTHEYKISSSVDVLDPISQLFTLGIDNPQISYRQYEIPQMMDFGRRIFIQLDIDNQKGYQIIQRKNSHLSDEIISEFEFYQIQYLLISAPIQK
jgi:hypothetical protein